MKSFRSSVLRLSAALLLGAALQAANAQAASAPTAPERPSCYSKTFAPAGSGTFMASINVGGDAGGKISYYHCPGPYFWTAVTVVCSAADGNSCTFEYGPLFADVAASGPAVALSRAWDQNIRPLTPNQKTLLSGVGGIINSDRPANPVFEVATNGSYATRTIYPFAQAASGAVLPKWSTGTHDTTKNLGGVAVKTVCDCSKYRSIPSTYAYCSVTGPKVIPPLIGVALCTPKK